MRNVIAWAVKRPTVVNLVMVGLALAGLLGIQQLPKESFPETTLDEVWVDVIHKGAGPKEIENGVLLKIEEAVQGVTGISQVRGEAREGFGTVRLELARGQKVARVVRDVKDQIERINTFPKDAENPRVYALTRRIPVIQFALYGKANRAALQTQANALKDRLLALSRIKQVDLQGAKQREIAIEINEQNLRKYNLQIQDITTALQQANFDLSGGVLKSKREDMRIRIYGKKRYAHQLAPLVIKHLPGGAPVRLRDVASVRESFEDTPQQVYFNGFSAILLNVQSIPQDDILKVAAQAKAFWKDVQKSLPAGIQLSIYQDHTIALKSRISLLVENGAQGLILILIVLSFFMNLRLAFWVASGLLLSILGAFMAAWLAGWSINMISLFGVILVIGILVDDAIVVAENIYSHLERGASPIEAAIEGTREVLPAVLTAVLTTCLTFMPLFFMGGFVGKFIYMIPAMVIVALLCSLFESLFILPPHLAHSLKRRDSVDFQQNRIRAAIDGSTNWLRDKLYAKVLSFSLKHRWPVVAGAITMMLLCFGLIAGGVVKFVFFPAVEGDRLVMRMTMKPGTPYATTQAIAAGIERKAILLNQQLKKQHGKSLILSAVRWQGSQSPTGMTSPPTGEEVAEVQLELLPGEERKISSAQILALWRKQVGPIPGTIQLSFDTLGGPSLGRPLEFQLTSNDPAQLLKAAAYVKKELSRFPGVYGAEDDLNLGKRELRLERTALAKSLGISMQEIAFQVRYRIYGQEVMRLQRGQDEVRIVVSLPANSREGVRRLEGIWLSDKAGKRHPLPQLVRWRFHRDLEIVRRIDRQRLATVFAQLDESQGDRGAILAGMQEKAFPKLASIAPAVKVIVAGQGREQAKVIGGVAVAFPIAMFGVFFVLTLIFGSYSKVLIVMSMIPFGVVGAVLGHWAMGIPLTILSFFGLVGVSGVVVNDSIVLMDAINRRVMEGVPVRQAVAEGAASRLRAILSTTLTTVAGLGPILFEKSLQARFLMPMALALASGVLFATFLTLFVVPCLYLIRNDCKRFYHWLRHGSWLDADVIEARDMKDHNDVDARDAFSEAQGDGSKNPVANVSGSPHTVFS